MTATRRPGPLTASAKAERILALAEATGAVDDLAAAQRGLAKNEAEYDASFGASRRNELARLMAIDIDELAEAYVKLAAVVERMPSA